MSLDRAFGWGLCGVWAVWLHAMQGLFASDPIVAEWTPDLGLVLLIGLDPRLERGDSTIAACVVAASRIALSSDPPLAILVGYLTVVGASGALRRAFDFDHFAGRAVLGALFALLLPAYWDLAHAVVLAGHGVELPRAGWALTGAAATAVAAALLAPALARLPGLTLIVRRKR